MMYRIAFILLFSLFTLPSLAEPALWRVDRPSDSQASRGQLYLFGSIHFGGPDMYPMPPQVNRAFQQSEALAVELDLLSVDSQQVSQLLAATATYPEGKTLRDDLSQQQWQRLSNIAAGLNAPLASLARMKPWLVAVQLVTLQLKDTPYSKELGIDRHFLQRAKWEGKTVIELESLHQQMALFQQLTLNEQMLLLNDAISQHDRGIDYLNLIADAWRNGDIARLEQVVIQSFESSSTPDVAANLFRRVFTDRNLQMADNAEKLLLQDRRVFLVVGAGHMLGATGLVQEFIRRGYRVTRIEK